MTQGSFLHPISYYWKLNFLWAFSFKVSIFFFLHLALSHTFFNQNFVVSNSSKNYRVL